MAGPTHQTGRPHSSDEAVSQTQGQEKTVGQAEQEKRQAAAAKSTQESAAAVKADFLCAVECISIGMAKLKDSGIPPERAAALCESLYKSCCGHGV